MIRAEPPSQPGALSEIPFNRPAVVGAELESIRAAMDSGRLSGSGAFCKRCEAELRQRIGAAAVFLTPSCTASLEMAALLLDIGPGDEVIMSSFTHVSTANAFAMRGARIVCIDVRPDTMNLDERLIEAAITSRSRAIVAMHYGGVACDMGQILDLAARHGLSVVEDAAHAIGASYRVRPLGSFGQIATLSFHETKNITSGGEGGLTILNDPDLVDRAHIARDMGTDRQRFLGGQVDKYKWVDLGSSYLMNEVSAAYLWPQLQQLDAITSHRRALCRQYSDGLAPLVQAGRIEVQSIPDDCTPNGHLFAVKVADEPERTRLVTYLAERRIKAVFHYVPLHSSTAGLRFTRFHGDDRYTTKDSRRLLRLPLYYDLTSADVARICEAVRGFFCESMAA